MVHRLSTEVSRSERSQISDGKGEEEADEEKEEEEDDDDQIITGIAQGNGDKTRAIIQTQDCET